MVSELFTAAVLLLQALVLILVLVEDGFWVKYALPNKQNIE